MMMAQGAKTCCGDNIKNLHMCTHTHTQYDITHNINISRHY
jgi:hypothetical protein